MGGGKQRERGNVRFVYRRRHLLRHRFFVTEDTGHLSFSAFLAGGVSNYVKGYRALNVALAVSVLISTFFFFLFSFKHAKL